MEQGDETEPSVAAHMANVARPRAAFNRLAIRIGLALLAAFLLYKLEPDWFVPSDATVPPTPTATPRAPTPTPTPPVSAKYYIGSTQSIDNIWIKPVAVRITPGNGTTQPNVGDAFVVVILHIENHRERDFDFAPSVPCPVAYCNFYVRDAEGRKNPPVPFDPYHLHLRPVVLQPGSSIDGSYTFEVPESDVKRQDLQLLYYHDPLLDANNVVHWLLRYPKRH